MGVAYREANSGVGMALMGVMRLELVRNPLFQLL